MRGTDVTTSLWSTARRITPACAGNSSSSGPRLSMTEDHPRVCGEQPERPTKGVDITGSPPRVRGTAKGRWAHMWQARITPACAGNSWHLTITVQYIKDHPRVCGEQKQLHSKIQRPGGSPPRVRGTGIIGPGYEVGNRITPACAGNSCFELPQAHRP